MSANDVTPPQFLSQAGCRELIARARTFARGGGETTFAIYSSWRGYLRWARNRVSATGDVRNTRLIVTRTADGTSASFGFNQVDDTSLKTAVESAEWFLQAQAATNARRGENYDAPFLRPTIFSDETFNLSPVARSDAAQPLMDIAERSGMLSAGYIQVEAAGVMVDLASGLERYYPYTTAQYSVTTRDPHGSGSGWAGVDSYDWRRIDTATLSRVALDKCVKSMNPVAVEPGRYTVILEPQAVADLVRFVVAPEYSWRVQAEQPGASPYSTTKRGLSKIGQKLIDERVTISADVMDPELGAVPFDWDGAPFLPAVWFEHGVLKNLYYNHAYAVQLLRKNDPLLNRGSFRMSGGTTSMEEMIATTKRGLIITRFDGLRVVDRLSLLANGYTRDGVWLIENGKISKAVKNFRIAESPLFVLNNIDAMGVPVRVFSPDAPIVVPPLKVRDFSLIALADAV